jgi:hypothetical protein
LRKLKYSNLKFFWLIFKRRLLSYTYNFTTTFKFNFHIFVPIIRVTAVSVLVQLFTLIILFREAFLSDGKNLHLSKWTFKFVLLPLDRISLLQYLHFAINLSFSRKCLHMLFEFCFVDARFNIECKMSVSTILSKKNCIDFSIFHTVICRYFYIVDISTTTLVRIRGYIEIFSSASVCVSCRSWVEIQVRGSTR